MKKELNIYIDALNYMLDEVDVIDAGYIKNQFEVFESLIHYLTKDEGLVFNTLFAKISYLGLKYKPSKKLIFDIHIYRKEVQGGGNELDEEMIFGLGLYVIKELLRLAGLVFERQIERPEFKVEKKILKGRKLFGRYALIGKHPDGYLLVDEEQPTSEIVMKTEGLDIFRNSINYIDKKISNSQLPITIELIYIDIDSDDRLIPQSIVILPDILIDVTAIAECFKPSGGDSRYYLINKLLKKPKNKYITIGNIVNYFLDELMNNPDLEFSEILHSIFYLDAIMFALMKDNEVKELVMSLRTHFNNLKRVVNEDLPSMRIDRTKCYIEPSFYSPVFGIQGRLDIFYQEKNSNEAAIVELKSGKLFMANSYGLNTNHYTQTLLYELMIKSVFDFRIKPINYILYSVLDSNNIRFAPTIAAQQKEAISIRNDIVAIEEDIINAKENPEFYEKLKIEEFPGSSGFLKRDLEVIQDMFHRMSKLEKSYFCHFASFISREHRMAKSGSSDNNSNRGQSNLWLMNDKEKEEHFSILRHMVLLKNRSKEEISSLDFMYSEHTNILANFRKGDIVLIYPSESRINNKIRSQIFKGTVLEIRSKAVKIRLRNKVHDQSLFDKYKYWNIEHDFLDSGFGKMFKSLTGFFSSDKDKIHLILAKKAPEIAQKNITVDTDEDITDTQRQMIKNIVNAKDYYLLWGPPGTGKTSKIIRQTVKSIHDMGENVMLLAYTNRAVDELCEAVESLGDSMKQSYLRIGSRFSSDPKFEDNMYENKLRTIKTRKELKSLFNDTGIFVSTVSSLQGKEELFSLKKFDTLIVDEASQLLEPMLIAVLPYFKRFVLVGDHMQLSAVVTQPEKYSKVLDKELLEVGLTDMRISLFERLLGEAIKNKWDWAYGMLNEQGRMHKDIMRVANRFYIGKLKIIDSITRLSAVRELSYEGDLQKTLATKRLLYFPTKKEEHLALSKANIYEAKSIVDIIIEITKLYKLNDKIFNDKTIGVITTFRAQIAIIRKEFEDRNIDFSNISIDTVERYQGSARDIIIYSASVNSLVRLNQIVALNKDGIDRKLNVVLTRAKEQFIIIGNKEILSTNAIYKNVISSCYEYL